MGKNNLHAFRFFFNWQSCIIAQLEIRKRVDFQDNTESCTRQCRVCCWKDTHYPSFAHFNIFHYFSPQSPHMTITIISKILLNLSQACTKGWSRWVYPNFLQRCSRVLIYASLGWLWKLESHLIYPEDGTLSQDTIPNK